MEDRATLQVLASLGCDLAQGYHFSPPVGAAELAGWAAGVGPGGLAQPERDSVEAARGERVRGRSAHLAAEEDFLARKRAEAALRASEERYRSVVDSVRDIIFQSDADGRWTVTATSGEQALERLAADPSEVVISDVGMGPGMNGWELAAGSTPPLAPHAAGARGPAGGQRLTPLKHARGV